MGSLHLGKVALSALFISAFLTGRQANAAIPQIPGGLNDRCAMSFEATQAIVLDCQPGFVTAHDRIVVYPRRGVDTARDPRGQLDDGDAVWLFEPGAADRVALLIDSHRDRSGRPVADLHDSEDGQRGIDYIMVDGLPKALDHSGRSTVTVTSRDASWLVAGRPSFNLDITVDGPVRASFGSSAYLPLLQNDGHPDFEIHVRDTNDDGGPDLEWRQFFPPLPENPRSSGYIRTEIAARLNGGPVPISGSLFWPYLAETPTQYVAGEYLNPNGLSPAPVEVDWANARIVQVSEFVASHGPASYSIYSINRIQDGTTNAANFENPSAFYDLAGAGDGWPDMGIRFQVALPDEVLVPRRNADPINVIEYSWGLQHDHNWTYGLSLVGHQSVHESIQFPSFVVRGVPPAVLPGWVGDQQWDSATFVEVPQPYPATAHINQYTVEQGDNVLPLRYLTGIDSLPPTVAFSQIAEGFRGEYALDLGGRQARLYLSPVDLRLHLLYADGGIWNLGSGRQLRCESLAGPAIDHWTLLQDSVVIEDLYVLADQVVYVSAHGVTVGKVRPFEDLRPLAPPKDQETWMALRALLKRNGPSFAPDDLQTMFSRIATSVQRLPLASAFRVRPFEGGFTFVLTLPDVSSAVAWAAGHPSGDYLAYYRRGDGYDLQPLTPPALTVGEVEVAGGEARATASAELSASVLNLGHADGDAVHVTFLAGRDGTAMEPVGTAVVDVPGDGAAQARAQWTPPAGGRWFIQAIVNGPHGAGPITAAGIAAPADLNAPEVLAAQDVRAGGLIGAAVLLLVGALAASRIGSRLLHP